MAGQRLRTPAASALSILEEYHRDVESKLKDCGLGDDETLQITTDVYAKDDIYFSLNRPYKQISDDFREFCKKHKLNLSLPDMLPQLCRENHNLSLYEHQAQAIESILAERTTIIATGTGSGKTEAFLVPILHHCLLQKAVGQAGIKAIILYPLNALANDQIRRITKAVSGKGIRVGCFVGSTPPHKERKGEPDELCICRSEMIDKPPDILITNYVILDRLITKPETRSMFARSEHTIKYLVVDEVHFFRGIKGANLSLLLQRLRALCKQPLVQIGASGTLRRSGGYYPDDKRDKIQQFVHLIFGAEAITRNGFRLIEPVFKEFEQGTSLPPLPAVDDIPGGIKDDAFLANLDNKLAVMLGQQLSGNALTEKDVKKDSFTPLYDFVNQSEFIASIRKKLIGGACTFNDLVELFCELYRETHHHEPHNPKDVVKAYWSLINHINHRCKDKKRPLILDYRLHLILGDVGGSLTRCLLCKRYHDSRCSRCRYCNNGLLFRVSQKRPELCIGYLIGREIFPDPPDYSEINLKMDVLIQVAPAANSSGLTQSLFNLEPKEDPATGQESYVLQPAPNGKDGVSILFPQDRQVLEKLPLSDPRLYWHNVLKAIDALVVRPETKISNKLLGFIDNKERASSIKLRLNDEIADRTLTKWAISNWRQDEEMPLLDAFNTLQKAIPSTDQDEEVTSLGILFQEMPFWFSRMLASLEDYKDWQVLVNKAQDLNDDEYELLQEIMLREGAIDRTSFPVGDLTTLKHFYIEKYKVDMQYGIGTCSIQESKLDITSLGEQGRIYENFIERMKEKGIRVEKTLEKLTNREILVRKQALRATFYQLHPKYLALKPLKAKKTAEKWQENFITVECHTADHSDKVRAEIEANFLENNIEVLICTPTLEMGVDIGDLSSVLMIGFPPSPANYAQRAGRAGRGVQNRLATIVVLSSAEDSHDEYYYANPEKMIDGAITPPQFTLINFALLASHIYAYLSAESENPLTLTQPIVLREYIRNFMDRDPLHLREELSQEDFARFTEYLYKDSQKIATRLRKYELTSVEECYRLGIFPDYGFRRDGLPLMKQDSIPQYEDEEEVLTVREAEDAVRKLVPGRIVFCGGKAVKVDENQPDQSFQTQYAPDGKAFRIYNQVVADEKNLIQIEKKRDPDSRYKVSRILDMKKPLEALEMHGPAFCRIYLVRQGTLLFINEGKLKAGEKEPQPLEDARGTYRFGTNLERDGLLIHFADHILPPNMKANLLAVLLRCIPDCFDLDDNELRVAKYVQLHPQPSSEPREWSSFFIYGQDESDLVPFERIFEHLDKLLKNALHTLRTCSCNGEGCYLCLFSLNSRSLSGRISPQKAINTVSIFLRESLLKPHLATAKSVMGQADITLSISLSGNKCSIVTKNARTGSKGQYVRENALEDENTRIYTALREALEQERDKGTHTVKICSNIDHICKQLTGENNVNTGREAFLKAWLSLLSWQDWEIVKE